MEINHFGIRHHGPGSSLSLLTALEEFSPDCVLIELPEDTSKLINDIKNEELIPPVAILLHNTENLKEAAYFPFACFSPEWQAIKYCFRKDITIRCFDLPMSLGLRLTTKSQSEKTSLFDSLPEKHLKRQDPFLSFARLHGYQDTESWWGEIFEHQKNPKEIFDVIGDLMETIRQENSEIHTETLIREAYMRLMIRASINDGFQKIAVVCGAWHVPALKNLNKPTKSQDKNSLKGLKKVKTDAVWIPWTYTRLSSESGYAAGVISPAWYETLFRHSDDAAEVWITEVAKLMREKDLPASTSNVIEAVRLAQSLATLRGINKPGIDDLQEATIASLGNGGKEAFAFIVRKLVIGERVGTIPPSLSKLPLEHDFFKSLKKFRLQKEWGQVLKIEKKLDLRKSTHLQMSQFFFRLNILQIDWAQRKTLPNTAISNFNEWWSLAWHPEINVKIVSSAYLGISIEDAATTKVAQTLSSELSLSQLTKTAYNVIFADLPRAIATITRAMQTAVATSHDPILLIDALAPLVRIVKYGDTRKSELTTVLSIVEQIVPRIFVQLPTSVIRIDQDAAKIAFESVLSANHSFSLLNNANYTQTWYSVLLTIIDSDHTTPTIKGLCSRLLFDAAKISSHDVGTLLRFALSKGNNTIDQALWIEGFLHGNGLILLHNAPLIHILDQWVQELQMENLVAILPILRRAFGSLSAADRKRLFAALTTSEPTQVTVKPNAIDIPQAWLKWRTLID